MALPIRARLALWYSAVLILIVVSLSAFLVVRLRANLTAGLDSTLATRAQQIALAIGQRPDNGPGAPKGEAAGTPTEDRAGGAATSTPGRAGDPSSTASGAGGQSGAGGDFADISDAPRLAGLPLGNSIAQVLGVAGQVLQSSGGSGPETPLLPPPALARAARAPYHAVVAVGFHKEPYRVLAIGLAGSREVIAVAGPTRDIDRAVGSLIALLAFTIPVALVMSVAGGYLVSARAMRPVDWMTREAAAIGADDLSVRLDVPSTSDEIERLGRTLNQLLSRLSASMEEQRRFTADASHELRTPLSIMRGEIDTTLRSHDLAPDARPALESLGEEVDRMSGLVSDLLTLSRMDAGSAELSRERVRLAELCDKVAGRFSARAAAKAVTLDVQGEDLTVWADLDLLDRMIGNLVDNAIKYSPPGGLVRLAVRRDGDWADMTVADSGAGIAPEDLPHVFERFWRADKARARAEGGAGLGLSICRWIAEAHCGSIAASSHPGGGTTITVRLPLERDA